MGKKTIVIGIILVSWSFLSSVVFEGNIDKNVVVKAIFIDEFGNKWFGTSEGLYVFNDTVWMKYSSDDHLISNRINALTFEQSSYGPEIWVATDQGVSVLAFDVDGVTSATSYSAEDGLMGTKIADVVVDSRSNKFFGSDKGVTFFHDGTMDSITYEDNKTSLIDAPVNDMAISNDSIYIGYSRGIGRLISEVDGVTGASRWTNGYGITPLSGNILAVEIDSDGNQWFGTDAGAEKHIGLSAKENWILYTEDDGLANNMVRVIREGKDGSIWFGTEGGVSVLKDDMWTSYNKSDGLAGGIVYDIAFEDDGTVWFATDNGISVMKENAISTVDIALSVDDVMNTFAHARIYQENEKNLVVEFNRTMNAPVQFSVYDIHGKLVGTANKDSFAGHKFIVEMDFQYTTGIYLVQVKDNKGLLISKKVLLLK
jgi:ligand-binding sensor domain-containing protein